MKRFAWPLVVFSALVAFMAAGLTLNPREVPSPLIGKPAPAFRLPVLDSSGNALSANDLRGRVWLLNVWASWCVACRLEHETVRELAGANVVAIYGLNYKDKAGDAARWLQRFGNPYVASLSDTDGLVGIDFGVYGVPETFVIDKNGVIRQKIIGPLTPQALRDTIIPLVRELNG